nr:MAG TPA: hypothetical protein [Caudoviricetes sp.]
MSPSCHDVSPFHKNFVKIVKWQSINREKQKSPL